MALEIASKQLSVRQVEKLVASLGGQPKQKKVKRKKDPNTLRLEKEISEKLGAKTDIAHNKRGEGKLIINFKNLNELQGILDKIK